MPRRPGHPAAATGTSCSRSPSPVKAAAAAAVAGAKDPTASMVRQGRGAARRSCTRHAALRRSCGWGAACTGPWGTPPTTPGAAAATAAAAVSSPGKPPKPEWEYMLEIDGEMGHGLPGVPNSVGGGIVCGSGGGSR
ncbi:hypothetical protein HK405_011711, partial [Cladochytrium tenue]